MKRQGLVSSLLIAPGFHRDMSRIVTLLALTAAVIIMASGCGSGGTLTLNKPMKSGDATITVTSVATSNAIKSPNREVVKPELPGQVFLFVTYDVKNNSDKSVVVIDPWITKNPKGPLFTEALTSTAFYGKEFGVDLNGTQDSGEVVRPGEQRNNVLAIYTLIPPYAASRKAGQALEQSAATVQEIFPGNGWYFVVADKSFTGQSLSSATKQFFSYSRQTGTPYEISPIPKPSSEITTQNIKERRW